MEGALKAFSWLALLSTYNRRSHTWPRPRPILWILFYSHRLPEKCWKPHPFFYVTLFWWLFAAGQHVSSGHRPQSVPANQSALVLGHPHRWEANVENLHFPSLDDPSAWLNTDGREFIIFSRVSGWIVVWSWCKKMVSKSSNLKNFTLRNF